MADCDFAPGFYPLKSAKSPFFKAMATLKSEVLDLRNRSIQYNILQRELDTNRSLYDGLLQQYKEVGVTGAVSTNNVSMTAGSAHSGRLRSRAG